MLIVVLVLVIGVMAAGRLWFSEAPEVLVHEPAGADTPGAASVEQAVMRREKSIAVLPFDIRGAAGKDTHVFSDGFHGDLLTRLSHVHELKVIARTSVMAYRDTANDLLDIGRELGVAHVLQSSMQRAGERIRINLQLVDAATGVELWMETYDVENSAGSIFRVQGDIARTLAGELGATLSPAESEYLGRVPTGNLEAYRAVLLSRQHQQSNGVTQLHRAVEQARRAIVLDPDFADAHAVLAEALITSINEGAKDRPVLVAEITTAIDHAITIDPDHAAAWAALGFFRSSTRQAGFEQAFEKSLEQDPGNVRTMTRYGLALLDLPAPDRALAILQRAVEFDPLSIETRFALGRIHARLNQLEAAREAFASVRETAPESPLAYHATSATYMAEGKIDRSLEWLSAAQAADPHDYDLASWILFHYDCLEHPDGARAWSDWLDGHITSQPLPLSVQAKHQYLYGNFELALQYANLAINMKLEDRRGSDATFMRIKRDEAIANGDPATGIRLFEARHPELLENDPRIDSRNLSQAVSLGLLLSLDGRKDRSTRLLEAAIAAYDRPWAMSGPENIALAPAKAEALAILGRVDEALAELRRVIDSGWRIDWRWSTDLNAAFNRVRERAEFRAMLHDLEEDIAVQRERVYALEDEGAIAPPAPLPENRLLDF